MINLILIIVLLLIVGGAAAYIVKSKKSGVKCIGCPNGGKCASAQEGCSGDCAGCSCGHK